LDNRNVTVDVHGLSEQLVQKWQQLFGYVTFELKKKKKNQKKIKKKKNGK
jgi:hypothetical protein